MPNRKNEKKDAPTEWVEQSKETVDQITQTRTFEPFSKPMIGGNIFIFRKISDSIAGILGPGIANIRRSKSYPIKTDDGEVLEIFGNKLLHRIIKKHDLIGAFVKIEYIGRQETGWGHARKIYRVYRNKSLMRYDWEFVQQTEEKIKKITGGTDA